MAETVTATPSTPSSASIDTGSGLVAAPGAHPVAEARRPSTGSTPSSEPGPHRRGRSDRFCLRPPRKSSTTSTPRPASPASAWTPPRRHGRRHRPGLRRRLVDLASPGQRPPATARTPAADRVDPRRRHRPRSLYVLAASPADCPPARCRSQRPRQADPVRSRIPDDHQPLRPTPELPAPTRWPGSRLEAATDAALPAHPRFPGPGWRRQSSATDVVTDMDRQTQELLAQTPHGPRPGRLLRRGGRRQWAAAHHYGSSTRSTAMVNYVYDIPAYAVSVAAVTGDVARLARLSSRRGRGQPSLRERFWGDQDGRPGGNAAGIRQCGCGSPPGRSRSQPDQRHRLRL